MLLAIYQFGQREISLEYGFTILKVLSCKKKILVKTKMAFLPSILILRAIFLYEQYIHYTQASLCPNMQYFRAELYAYQSFLSFFLV